jgi:hypothetical protein
MGSDLRGELVGKWREWHELEERVVGHGNYNPKKGDKRRSASFRMWSGGEVVGSEAGGAATRR